VWFAGSLGAVTLAVFANYLSARLFSFEQAVGRFFLIGSCFGVGLLWCLYSEYSLGIETIAALLLYAVFCELYVFLFTFVLGSVSANIVLRLNKRSLNDQQLNDIYSSEAMVELRIDRLLEKGLLLNDGDQLRSSKGGQRVAVAFNRLQRLFGHP
jgi:hypothetical protein